MPYEPLIRKISDTGKSSLRKYQDLFIGSTSLVELGKYELLTSLLGLFPGALGIFLRSRAYRVLFKEYGKQVFWGRGVTIRVPSRIELGDHIIVDDNAVLDAKGNANVSSIRFGNEVEIGRNTILSCKVNGSIVLGNFVSIGRNALLSATNELSIGNGGSIGPYCCLLASGHGWSDADRPIMLQNRDIKKIVLAENVWLGARVTVFDGVRIGRNSIIAAGSIVTEDIPPNRIAAGVPARIIAKRDTADVIEFEERIADSSAFEDRQVEPPAPPNSDAAVSQQQQVAGRSKNPIETPHAVVQLLYEAIDEINLQRSTDQQLEKSTETLLFDNSGTGSLDSLGLLNLIVTTEQKVFEEFGIEVDLASEKAMSQEDGPFLTVRTLADYIASLLKEQTR